MKLVMTIAFYCFFLYCNADSMSMKSSAEYKNDTLFYHLEIFNNSSSSIYIQIENWDSYGDYPDGSFFSSSRNGYWMFYNNFELYNKTKIGLHCLYGYTSPAVERLPKFYELKKFERLYISIILNNPFSQIEFNSSDYEYVAYIKYLTYSKFKRAVAIEKKAAKEFLVDRVPKNRILLTDVFKQHCQQRNTLPEKVVDEIEENSITNEQKKEIIKLNKLKKLIKFKKTITRINSIK